MCLFVSGGLYENVCGFISLIPFVTRVWKPYSVPMALNATVEIMATIKTSAHCLSSCKTDQKTKSYSFSAKTGFPFLSLRIT